MAPLFLLILLLLPSSSAAQIRLWCVAKNNAEDPALQAALDWACSGGGGGVDCGAVQPGGACFEPDVLQFHASYAFNSYYSGRPSDPSSCDFSGNAALTQLDPTSAMDGVNPNCKFPASLSVSNGSLEDSSSSVYEAGAGPGGSNSNGVGCLRLNHLWAFLWTLLLGLHIAALFSLLRGPS